MARQKRQNRTAVPRFILALLAILVLVIVWRLVSPTDALAHHPEPQAGIDAGSVADASRYAAAPDVAATYAAAAEIPHILDGLYCHCDCSLHSGHRSLLTCFESDHGAACDVCLAEARIARQLHQQGRSLDEIRAAVDELVAG